VLQGHLLPLCKGGLECRVPKSLSGMRFNLVVIAELLLIAWIRNRYIDTPLLAATFQVVVGGVIVFLAGILIGIS
jgi:hypothetical protein